MQQKIQIKNVSFSYQNDNRQLDNIDLTISKGDCVAVVGSSGCGKSTLTRLINGLIPSFFQGNLEGKISIDNTNLQELSSWEIGAMVGNVFQDPRSQFFSNEVAGEIAFGCENLGLSHEQIIERVNKTVNEMHIEDLLNTSIYKLSYGMRQKVAICSAKAMEPDIYVLDEPSANLDLKSTYLLAELIQFLKDKGKTILIAEHRLFYLNGIVDKYIFMKNGKITDKYSAKQMQQKGSKSLNNHGLRSLNFEDISVPKVKNMNISTTSSFETLNLSKSFGKKTLLNDICFKYNKNEIIALVGQNGVGKSTLGKMLAGLIKETSGKVLLDQRKKSCKKRIGDIWYIPQDLDSQLFGESLVDELTTGLDDSKDNIVKAEKILDKLGLLAFKDKHPATLSGGQKQRLVLGVAMMRKVPMIILDEPTSGLDFNSMEKVKDLIKEQKKNGTKFLIISHDIEFIARSCDRILKLDNGKIKEDYYLNKIEDLLESMDYNKVKKYILSN